MTRTYFGKTRTAGRFKPLGYALMLLASIALVGCEDSGISPQERINKAGELYESGQIQEAIIELKNALQDEPDNVAGRFMLGKIYVDIGDGASGEKELLSARDLGMELGSFLKPLGRAWLLQGQFNKLLEEVEFDAGASSAIREVQLLLRGNAFFELGQYDDAIDAFTQALQINPESADSLIGLAFAQTQTRAFEDAEANIGRARDLAPNNPLALKVLGDLTYRLQRYDESYDAYKQAVELNNFALLYRIGLGRSEIATERFDEGLANLNYVLERVPNHVFTNFLKALALYRKGEFEQAKNTSEAVLEINNTHVPSFLIAGASSYAMEQFEQANLYLGRFIETNPNHDGARRVLGATQLRLGQSFEAMQTLAPLADSEEALDDSSVLSMVGQAAMRSGEVSAASRYFQMAVDSEPENAQFRTQLAVAKFALDEQDEGFEELQKAIAAEPGYLQAEFSLLNAHLQVGEFEKVLEIAESIQGKRPDSPTAWIGAGLAHLGLDQTDNAKQAFEKALEIDPKHIGAAFALAQIHLSGNQPEQTIPIYEMILGHAPGHLRTLMRLAAVYRQGGQPEKSIALLNEAAETNPDALEPRTLLAQDYLRQSEPRKAVLVLTDVEQTHGENPLFLTPLIQANLSMGEFGSALRYAEQLAKVAPRSATAHFLLAESYGGQGNGEKVLQELEIATGLAPNFLAAQIALVRAYFIAGRLEDAQAGFSKLVSVGGENPDVLALQGWLAQQMGDNQQAVTALEAAYDHTPSRRNTIDLAVALWSDNREDDAISLLGSWVDRYPDDASAIMELANFHVLKGNLDTALPMFEKILEHNPDSVLALTNAASIMLDQDPARALEMAGRAYELFPSSPPIAITYAESLVRSEEYGKGQRVLERVLADYPEEDYTKLLYAQTLIRNGDRTGGKENLDGVRLNNLDSDQRILFEQLKTELSQ